MSIPFVGNVRFIGIYPLKQFAPSLHGNPRVRAASQWAKTTTDEKSCPIDGKELRPNAGGVISGQAILVRKQKLLRNFGPSRCFPVSLFSVEEGGNCLSGGKALHLMLEPIEFMHLSGCFDQQASFSPATEKRLTGK